MLSEIFENEYAYGLLSLSFLQNLKPSNYILKRSPFLKLVYKANNL